jgi:hypothetical protein
VMCRNTLSIGYDGTLYDCDFNQMLDLPVHPSAPRTIFDFDLAASPTARSCWGRTASAAPRAPAPAAAARRCEGPSPPPRYTRLPPLPRADASQGQTCVSARPLPASKPRLPRHRLVGAAQRGCPCPSPAPPHRDRRGLPARMDCGLASPAPAAHIGLRSDPGVTLRANTTMRIPSRPKRLPFRRALVPGALLLATACAGARGTARGRRPRRGRRGCGRWSIRCTESAGTRGSRWGWRSWAGRRSGWRRGGRTPRGVWR